MINSSCYKIAVGMEFKAGFRKWWNWLDLWWVSICCM